MNFFQLYKSINLQVQVLSALHGNYDRLTTDQHSSHEPNNRQSTNGHECHYTSIMKSSSRCPARRRRGRRRHCWGLWQRRGSPYSWTSARKSQTLATIPMPIRWARLILFIQGAQEMFICYLYSSLAEWQKSTKRFLSNIFQSPCCLKKILIIIDILKSTCKQNFHHFHLTVFCHGKRIRKHIFYCTFSLRMRVLMRPTAFPSSLITMKR